MTYEEAWEKSTGWVQHYWEYFKPKKIEYQDYFQECALYFFSKLKPKFEPYYCWCLSKRSYKWVMLHMTYNTKDSNVVFIPLSQIDEVSEQQQKLPEDEWFIELKPHLKEVAQLIADDYSTDEICAITGKTKDTIYSYIKIIKQIYADAFVICDYQRKHLRTFKRYRTTKEIENWQINKNRLAEISRLKREKVKQMALSKIDALQNYLTIGDTDSSVSIMVMDLAGEALSKFVEQSDYINKDDLTVDEIVLSHNTEFASLDEFVREFWDKAVAKILDLVREQ